MPIAANIPAFTEALRSFMDPDFAGYVAPTGEVDAATRWADAVDILTASGLAIAPPSATGLLAKAALSTGLLGMSAPGVGPAVMDLAFVAYAGALIPGMLPAFVGTPPPPGLLSAALLSQAALALPPNPPLPGVIQVASMASVIALWFSGGTATPSGGGPPVPWS